MTNIALALIFGFFIPYMARRFAKFMPATFAGALVELFRRERKLSSVRKSPQYKKFIARSFMGGLFSAALVGCAVFHFPVEKHLFTTLYILVLLLAAEIDYRSFFLPDILTIPLLILGFLASCLSLGFVPYCESAFGAVCGYFLPVLVCLLIVWYKKDAFGGGDIKLLSALGAWLGVEGLIEVIALSSILGLVYALITRKKELAFGPMIALSGIAVAFFLF